MWHGTNGATKLRAHAVPASRTRGQPGVGVGLTRLHPAQRSPGGLGELAAWLAPRHGAERADVTFYWRAGSPLGETCQENASFRT